MCRLAIFGGVEDFRDIARALHQLEVSMGGDGNGYYRPGDALLGTAKKGVDLTTAEVAFKSYGEGSTTPTYFHTRYATAGGILDTICHPFEAGSQGMLMHNGHWHNWHAHNRKGEVSDTQTAARIVAENGLGVLLSKSFDYSGVYIVASDSGAYVSVSGGDFYFQWPESGGFFHASEVLLNMEMAEIKVAMQDEVYFVANDGSVTLVTDSVEIQKMPKPINRPKKKKSKKSKKGKKNQPKWGRAFSGSTETHERGSEADGSWVRWDTLAEAEKREALDELLNLASKADREGIQAMSDWELKQLAELDRQLEDDEFFKSIKPTEWE